MYITNLPPVVRGFDKRCNIKVGSIVIMKDESLPRGQWPLAIVEEIFPGRDGLVRNVRVKTAKGSYTRSVQNLYDLELMHQPDDEVNVIDMNDDTMTNDNDDLNVVNNDTDISNVTIDNDNADLNIANAVDENIDIADIPVQTRVGRNIKPPRRLDL